jgi:hypothetical protein
MQRSLNCRAADAQQRNGLDAALEIVWARIVLRLGLTLALSACGSATHTSNAASADASEPRSTVGSADTSDAASAPNVALAHTQHDAGTLATLRDAGEARDAEATHDQDAGTQRPAPELDAGSTSDASAPELDAGSTSDASAPDQDASTSDAATADAGALPTCASFGPTGTVATAAALECKQCRADHVPLCSFAGGWECCGSGTEPTDKPVCDCGVQP